MANSALLVALDAAANALRVYHDKELELETLVRIELGLEISAGAGPGDWLPCEGTADYIRGFHDGLNARHGTGDYESLNCMGCGGIGHDDDFCG